VDGLKPKTDYTAKTHFEKGRLSSSENTQNFRTLAPPPSTAFSGKEVQRLLKNLKRNKSFVFNFEEPLAHEEAYKWETTVTKNLVQYEKYDISYKRRGDIVTGIEYKYDKAKAAKASKLTPRFNSILKGAKKKKGTRAKVIYVNSRMCKLASYDYKTIRNKDAGLPYSRDAFFAYGFFVKKKAVCSGYAQAFSAIMYQLGIPCTDVSSGGHIWNKVKIGNTWYHVDVTWNDCQKNKTKYLLKRTHP